jgi:hypothetical protein
MATPEFQSQFEKSNEASTPEFPLLKDLTPERLRSIARATGRTTPTGGRGIKGTPITKEGEIVRQMMDRNEWKAEQERSQDG